MLESIFLLLTVIGVVIVIMTYNKDYNDKTNEHTLKALIVFAGVCMVLASILDRLNL